MPTQVPSSMGPRPSLEARPGPALRARTVLAPQADPFEFLERLEGQPRYLYAGDGFALAGAGVSAVLEAHGASRFGDLRRAAARETGRITLEAGAGVPAPVGPRWMGGLSFEPSGDASSAFPSARFVLPTEQLLLERGQAFRTTIASSDGFTPRGPSRERPPLALLPSEVAWHSRPEFDAWATTVRDALHAVRSGAVEKVVLARTLHALLPAPPRLHRLLEDLRRASPTSRVFLVEPRPGHAFLGASPELLAARDDRAVTTAAIAGSRRRGRTPEEDASLERALLSSSKDAWEHELVCRFVRTVLDGRGRPWRTTADRQVLKLPNVQHIETRFATDPMPDEHLLELAQSLHPTPAVAGHPKAAALDLVRRLEGAPRGWYGGPVGWFDARGRGELSVALRSARVEGCDVVLHAGCGIVEGSDPAEEWEESRSKFQLLVDAFEREARA